MGKLHSRRIVVGELKKLRNWWDEIGIVFDFFLFDCTKKAYHVAKANLQPPPGEERGRSLGSN